MTLRNELPYQKHLEPMMVGDSLVVANMYHKMSQEKMVEEQYEGGN